MSKLWSVSKFSTVVWVYCCPIVPNGTILKWPPCFLRLERIVPEETGKVERMPIARLREKALRHLFKEQMFVLLQYGPADGY